MTRKNRKNLRRAILLSLLLGAGSLAPAAHAEEAPVYDLDTVVVTATKVEQAIKDVPASVTVITAADIGKMNIQTIDQALKLAAGVFDNRQKGLTSTTASVSMRGFSGTMQTLVLLDGQPMNQAYSGSVTWSAVPIESVERIEVVKGSGSALYGSTAMGGVINIITKSPDKREATISSKFETYGTWTNRMSVSDKLSDKLSYRINFERKTTNGYPSGLATASPSTGAGTSGVVGWTPTSSSTGAPKHLVGDTGDNTWKQTDIGGKLVYRIDASRSLTFGVLHDKYDYGYGSGHNYLTLNGAAYTGTVDVGGGQRITVSGNTFLGLPGGRESNFYTFGYKDKEKGWTFNAGLTDVLSSWYISSASSPGGGSGRISDAPNKRWNFDLQKELRLGDKDRMVVGVNYRHDWIHNQEYRLGNWLDRSSKTTLYSQAEGRSRTLAFFAQDERKLNDKLSLTVGGRYDKWTNYDGMNQDNSVATSDPTYYPERSDSAFSPKVALLYKADEKTGLHLSWSKAFQAPDLYTMYRGWLSTSNVPPGSTHILYDGNPDLKPQRVATVELGWNRKVNARTNMNITYFHNDITDIIYRRDLGINKPGTTYRWQRYENAGEGQTDGVEFEVSHRLDAVWTTFLNYTYQRAIISKNTANAASEGKQVQQVPKHLLNFGLDYQKGKWRGNLTGSYASKRYNSDDNSDVVSGVYGSYDPYFIVSIGAEYQWDKDNTVTFGVNNLFDRQYYSYYVAPGRTYSLQVTHKF